MSLHTIYLICLGIIVVLGLLTLWATAQGEGAYGKHMQSNKATMPAKAAWLLFECPQLFAFGLTFWWLFDWTAQGVATPMLVLFGLWQTHYLYRGLIYPLRRRDTGQRFPIGNVVMGFVFNALNGFVNAYAVTQAAHLLADGWLTSPWFVAGLVLAAVGWLINFQADNILINLRRGVTPDTRREDKYKIPSGGMFRYVSSANYLGEIMLWLGWALMVQTLAGWVFVFFTLANLVPRAVRTHQWYIQQFPDYPTNRKAVFPYLY